MLLLRSAPLAATATSVVASPPAAEAKRLRTFVSCGIQSCVPGQRCQIGSAPQATIRDTSGKGSRYKVCLRGPGRKFRFCDRARARRDGRFSQVNLLRFDEEIGTYTVRWYRHGRRIGSWRFFFARGD